MSILNQDEHIISVMAIDFEEGFHSLFIAYYKPLIRIAQRMIGGDFAEDVVQDTFMMIWHQKAKFENVISLKAYLYSTVHHKCLNVIRKDSLLEKYQEESKEELFEEYILDEDLFSQLYRALENLPEHYKQTMMKTLEGSTIAEIACAMETTEDTIKAYKRRAKQLLRKKLCEEDYVSILFLITMVYLD
ncbi:MAG: RNA polymerase sigma factor [Bacteroidales bacterium]